jgi:UDP-2,3-diacylglucosamine hydrolase
VAAPASPATRLPLPQATPTFVAPGAWRAIDFISDLHLAQGTSRAFDAWAAHLRGTTADAVFILGDLFEVWVGDDMAKSGFEKRCAQVLSEAAATKTIAFMAGNRDFLVGNSMLASTGVLRLHDPTVISAFGTRVLVSHGDALCLDDVGYQRYRAVVHRPALQRAFLALPLSWRRAIGRAARRRSSALHTPGLGAFIDVDPTVAAAWLRSAQAPVLVHGHTHAPASHEIAPGLVRHVLSDWELDAGRAPRAEVLRWNADGFTRIAPEAAAPATANATP